MTDNIQKVPDNTNNKKDRSTAAVLFRVLGTIIILLVLLITIPSALPRVMGYDIYNIVSGSMLPTIPIGSAVYVSAETPSEISEGEIAAFIVEGEVVVHRVIANDFENHEVHTKGDANAAEDMWPVPYENIIGTVKKSVPYLGSIMEFATSSSGKRNLFIFLIAGIVFSILATLIDEKNKEPEQKSEENSTAKSEELKKYDRTLKVIIVLIFVIILALAAVMGYIFFVQNRYAKEREVNEVAADTFTNEATPEDNYVSNCPIEVNFEELWEVNPDIIGWIYCEDSVINYPICQGEDDQYYLHHSYDKKESSSGAIFIDMNNMKDFSDVNTILYGHHMKDGSMFASLKKWADQEYYDSHKEMWLITPECNYRIEIISGYYTDAYSDMYMAYRGFGDMAKDYIKTVYEKSQFTPDMTLEELMDDEDENQRYIMMSTCEYIYENARYALHGKLIKD